MPSGANKRMKRKRGRKSRKITTLRRRGGGRGPIVYRTLGGFPDSVQVKLRYSSFIRLNPAPANPDQHLFRCLSIFDPDLSGVGHQPMYFDQWAGIYTKYTVKGAKCTMNWLPGSGNTTNQPTGIWGIYTSTNQTGINVFTDTTGILEATNSTNMRNAGLLSTGLTNPSAQSKVTSYFSTRKFFGITDPNDGNAYSAETGTNPQQEAYFCCYYADINGNDPGAQEYYVQIDYIVEFRDRRPIDQS